MQTSASDERATALIWIDLLTHTMSGRGFYVVGQMPRAGPQETPAEQAWTVIKAIMRAGDKGAPGKALVLDVSDVWERDRTELDLPVEPENLVFVPSRAVNF